QSLTVSRLGELAVLVGQEQGSHSLSVAVAGRVCIGKETPDHDNSRFSIALRLFSTFFNLLFPIHSSLCRLGFSGYNDCMSDPHSQNDSQKPVERTRISDAHATRVFDQEVQRD